MNLLKKISTLMYLLIRNISRIYYTKISSRGINNDIKVIYRSGYNIDENTINIIFLMDHCWSTGDAYLPLLVWMKEHYADVRIIGIFYNENAGTKKNEEEFLFGVLKDTVDLIILNDYKDLLNITKQNRINRRFNNIKNVILKEKKSAYIELSIDTILTDDIKLQNVAIVLKDDGADDEIKTYIYNKYRNAVHITHPHAGFLAMTNNKTILLNSVADVYTKIDNFYKYENEKEIENKIAIVGTPRYDDWWKRRILNQKKFLQSQEKTKSEKFDEVIALFMGELFDPFRMLNSEFENFIITIKNIVKKKPSCCLLIKLHPKNDISQIEQYFEDLPADKWMVSTLQCMQLASLANIVICPGISTSTMDALVMGTPTIEYSEGKIKEYRYLCEDGSFGSFVKYHELAICVSTKEELVKMVNAILKKNVDSNKYRRKLKVLLNLDNKSSELFSKLVMSEIKNKQ